VNADPELNAGVHRHRPIPVGHARLHLGRAPQRIDHTAELDQHAVARCLDDTAMALGDTRIDQLDAYRLEPLQCPLLVHTDQARVAHHICGKDSGEAAGGGHCAAGNISLRRDYSEPVPAPTIHVICWGRRAVRRACDTGS
jgi:hypothetical protein